MSLRGKHLITFDDWSMDEIRTVIDLALDLKRRRARREILDWLKNQTLFMIFFEQSTRTRNSMEAAMTQLGGHAHDLTADKMQISHGETPRDTAQVLSRMGEAVAIRNCFHSVGNKYLTDIADNLDIPLISMQDDVYHPLQAIADQMTIEEHLGADLKGVRVAICWAYALSHAKPLSVPQSQALLFPRFGMDVVVAHPPEFPLQSNIIEKSRQNATVGGGSITITNSMEEAIRDADIVIPKNWGGFGFFDHYSDQEDQRSLMKQNLEQYRDWICDSAKMRTARKDAKVMHALPADRGREVTDEVLDSTQSIIYDEAENRLHTAKSVLSLLLERSSF